MFDGNNKDSSLASDILRIIHAPLGSLKPKGALNKPKTAETETLSIPERVASHLISAQVDSFQQYHISAIRNTSRELDHDVQKSGDTHDLIRALCFSIAKGGNRNVPYNIADEIEYGNLYLLKRSGKSTTIIGGGRVEEDESKRQNNMYFTIELEDNETADELFESIQTEPNETLPIVFRKIFPHHENFTKNCIRPRNDSASTF
jgi:hypothetical protein